MYDFITFFDASLRFFGSFSNSAEITSNSNNQFSTPFSLRICAICHKFTKTQLERILLTTGVYYVEEVAGDVLLQAERPLYRLTPLAVREPSKANLTLVDRLADYFQRIPRVATFTFLMRKFHASSGALYAALAILEEQGRVTVNQLPPQGRGRPTTYITPVAP